MGYTGIKAKGVVILDKGGGSLGDSGVSVGRIGGG